ncbi:2-dehydropantoate 2-reductase (Ketopantoate reductase) (KPA reductase) (KPR) [Linderina macrospora]|uniref:2-dehydropantoate 2-reductase (Ketopantoate reductase) (KPA reductase) (KPR) n=1 Tax=Linderina macrospora TaxID=4868 RepID=A0ACC1JG15_9FUNG|nr:2-dehydropantoate 2-reductase (Ketopantoate reductase) (KPA reductase) (KPR) [Linderina macrospora]
MKTHPTRKLLYNEDGHIAPWFAEDCQAETTDTASPIKQLVVTTKAQDTLEAFGSVKHRLDAQSTVVLLQNGMGTYEALQKECYPPQRQQSAGQVPAFVVGTNSHGCLRTDERFEMHHTAMAQCAFAVRPSLANPPPPLPVSALDMLTALSELPLSASIINWSDLHLQLLLKLAANATINPVTALTDSRNGYLAPPPEGTPECRELVGAQEMRSLLGSACQEIAAIYARALPHLHDQLTGQRIEEYVVHVASVTARNRSSMLQDVSAGRQTEVDWINGYLVRLGQQHGVPTPINSLLYTLVKLKEAARSHTSFSS